MKVSLADECFSGSYALGKLLHLDDNPGDTTMSTAHPVHLRILGACLAFFPAGGHSFV
jgi:hypothetical protein